MSCVTYNVSPVTCHLRQQPQPQTILMLSSTLCTLGWFAKTQKPEKKNYGAGLMLSRGGYNDHKEDPHFH